MGQKINSEREKQRRIIKRKGEYGVGGTLGYSDLDDPTL